MEKINAFNKMTDDNSESCTTNQVVNTNPALQETVVPNGDIPSERDLQATIDRMTKLQDDIYRSVNSLFTAYTTVSLLIFMVPIYVIAHYYVQNSATETMAYTTMVGVVALMLVGLVMMKYFT
jgi:hypothetical protein